MIIGRTIYLFCIIFILGIAIPALPLLAQPEPPTGLTATAYDSHIELNWFASAEPNLSTYRIYRSGDGENFEFLKSVNSINTQYIDFIGAHDQAFTYRLTASNTSAQESEFSSMVSAQTFEMTDEELLTMVQEYTFRYFWDFGHPVSGLTRERNTTSIVTMGGSGFGVMAILVGIERGFITREQGLQRLLKITRFLEDADRFKGVFPHWMNGATGITVPFSATDNGGDLVETAFLIQGLLTVRQYFDGTNEGEEELRTIITTLWEEVDWNWYRRAVQQVLWWHWSPEFGWDINLQIRGFNEAQIIYILAIASPTNGVPASLYHNGWAGGSYINGTSYYGFPLDVGFFRGGPLFFAHYSYLGFDPRGIKDAYTNYFNRNTYHTLINRAYCIDNPENHLGYSEVSWGLTASDNPFGYLAHEPTPDRDNGTITPTAALSSIVYTPELSIQALKHFYRELGDRLWGPMGFYDAFNLDEDWFATSYLAIDQGPIICMIENYRTQLLWNNFMANPEIQPALDAIGFEADTTTVVQTFQTELNPTYWNIYPNPATEIAYLDLQLPITLNNVTIELTNLQGQVVYSETGIELQQEITLRYPIPINHMRPGTYFLTVKSTQGSWSQRVLLVP